MKTTKKLAIILVIALLLVSMAALVACNNTPDGNGGEPGKYTVQVFLSDGTTPVEGLLVQLCVVDPTAEGGLGLCYTPQPTDATGTSVQEWEEDYMEIHFMGTFPDGYKLKEQDKNKRFHKGEKAVFILENA